jgi:hypothetical protein
MSTDRSPFKHFTKLKSEATDTKTDTSGGAFDISSVIGTGPTLGNSKPTKREEGVQVVNSCL